MEESVRLRNNSMKYVIKNDKNEFEVIEQETLPTNWIFYQETNGQYCLKHDLPSGNLSAGPDKHEIANFSSRRHPNSKLEINANLDVIAVVCPSSGNITLYFEKFFKMSNVLDQEVKTTIQNMKTLLETKFESNAFSIQYDDYDNGVNYFRASSVHETNVASWANINSSSHNVFKWWQRKAPKTKIVIGKNKEWAFVELDMPEIRSGTVIINERTPHLKKSFLIVDCSSGTPRVKAWHKSDESSLEHCLHYINSSKEFIAELKLKIDRAKEIVSAKKEVDYSKLDLSFVPKDKIYMFNALKNSFCETNFSMASHEIISYLRNRNISVLVKSDNTIWIKHSAPCTYSAVADESQVKDPSSRDSFTKDSILGIKISQDNKPVIFHWEGTHQNLSEHQRGLNNSELYMKEISEKLQNIIGDLKKYCLEQQKEVASKKEEVASVKEVMDSTDKLVKMGNAINNEQEEKTPMAIEKKKTNLETFIGNPKDEIKDAAWQVGALNLIEMVREPLAEAFVTQIGMGTTGVANKVVRTRIGEFLHSDLGRGATGLLLGAAFPLIGFTLPDEVKPYATRMATALREVGYEKVMAPFAMMIFGPIRESITNVLRGVAVTQQLRMMGSMEEAKVSPQEEDEMAVAKQSLRAR